MITSSGEWYKPTLVVRRNAFAKTKLVHKVNFSIFPRLCFYVDLFRTEATECNDIWHSVREVMTNCVV